jgi:hypothetical protein
MSQQDDVKATVLLAPFSPSRPCDKCLNEQVDTFFHQSATVGSPCWTDDPAQRVWQPHLDRRCLSCGWSWCERPADDAYAEVSPEEDPMTIRKTGSATGEVTGVEGDEGITKTAGAAWTAEAEAELQAENADADELES